MIATTSPQAEIETTNSLSGPVAKETGVLSRAVYSTSYGLSYSVMFPILFVSRALPWDSPAGRGFRDGAAAACERSEEAHRRMAAAAEKANTYAGNAYANVAQRVQERVEAVRDKVAERRFRRA